MTHSLSYDSDNDYVILRIHGEVTIDLVRELAPRVAAMFKEKNCSRLLNDMSEATINISVAQLYGSPKIMDESGIEHDTKRALVFPVSFNDAEFLENATVNRGHDFMAFRDVDEAKAWLLAE